VPRDLEKPQTVRGLNRSLNALLTGE